MENNLNNQKPVEFFSAERIKVEIDGQQILWRDMNLEIDSKIGEHTIGKIKYEYEKKMYMEIIQGFVSIDIEDETDIMYYSYVELN